MSIAHLRSAGSSVWLERRGGLVGAGGDADWRARKMEKLP